MATSGSYGSVNTYSLSEWQKLEANGAAFLPASGYRYGKSFYQENNGTYWSSSTSSNGAYNCDFHSNYIHPQTNGHLYYAEAVRLVIAE